jgi:hypothetical protein
MTYVISLSTQADDLSQWRAYGRGSGGVAIGFDVKALSKMLRPQFYLTKVSYAATTVITQMIKLMNPLPEIIERIERSLAEVGLAREECEQRTSAALAGRLQTEVVAIAPTVKEGSFSSEREWRYVAESPAGRKVSVKFSPLRIFNHRRDVARLQVRFRAGRSSLVPFLAPRIMAARAFTVAEVIVGPNPDPSTAALGVKLLLQRHGLDEPVVQSSTVPYRDW